MRGNTVFKFKSVLVWCGSVLSFRHAGTSRHSGVYPRAGVARGGATAVGRAAGERVSAADGGASACERGGQGGARVAARGQADCVRVRERGVDGAAPDDRGAAALARGGREAGGKECAGGVRLSEWVAGADGGGFEAAGVAARGGGRGWAGGDGSGWDRRAGQRAAGV